MPQDPASAAETDDVCWSMAFWLAADSYPGWWGIKQKLYETMQNKLAL